MVGVRIRAIHLYIDDHRGTVHHAKAVPTVAVLLRAQTPSVAMRVIPTLLCTFAKPPLALVVRTGDRADVLNKAPGEQVWEVGPAELLGKESGP